MSPILISELNRGYVFQPRADNRHVLSAPRGTVGGLGKMTETFASLSFDCAGGLFTATSPSFSNLKFVPGVVPKFTPLAPVNPFPVIDTFVPPECGPYEGSSVPATAPSALAP